MNTGAHGGQCRAQVAMPLLSDTALLQICHADKNDPNITPGWLADLGLVVPLVGQADSQTSSKLEAAVTLLGSLLGKLAHHNPVHLPFGYSGPRIRSRGWLDRQGLELVGQQIVGLLWSHSDPKIVRDAVHASISEAMHLGFMEQKEYDAWRPGMPSGSGWRSAVKATLYGVTRARLLAKSTDSSQGQPSPQQAVSITPPSGEARSCPANALPAADPVITDEPSANTSPPANGPTVKLARRGEPCYVCGKQKHPLTDAQYSVIQALQAAGEEGLSKDALEAVRPSARRILKNLRMDEDWARVILMPGRTNGRYRIRS